jgi:hypothetical protein
MKYIITESQQERIKKRISEFLNEKFTNSLFVCEINVYDVDEEEYDYEVEKGLKYDIYISLSHNLTKIYNQPGVDGLKKGIKMKISQTLSDWFGLDINEYYIGFLSKEC